MDALSDGYIHIVKWDTHQHRDAARAEVPTWIKTHTRLLSDDNYLDLSPHCRAVLHGLWLEYARSRCQLTANTASLSRRLGLRVSSRQLESLNDAGFITFSASKHASLEEKREEKKEQLLTPPKKPAVDTTPKPREKDPVWDFVVELQGEPLQRNRAGYGRITSDLRALLARSLNGNAADPAACVAELRRRHGALAAEWGDAKATARALVQHWEPAGKMADGLMRPPAEKHRDPQRTNAAAYRIGGAR